MKIRALFQIAFAFLCVATLGCDAGVDGRYPISETVQFGGEPLANGQISFQPTGGGTALSSSAAQVIKGKFEIPASKGLVPGEYSVVLTATEPSGQKFCKEATARAERSNTTKWSRSFRKIGVAFRNKR